ncbi:hypothetical protein ACROYT_G037529 [Oculina patagonica]
MHKPGFHRISQHLLLTKASRGLPTQILFATTNVSRTGYLRSDKMADVRATKVGWTSVHSAITKGDFSGFLKAVDVWTERPHVLNRRLMGALLVKRASFNRLTSKDLERLLVDLGTDTKHVISEREDIDVRTKSYAEEAKELKSHGEDSCLGTHEGDTDTVIVRKLLPKQMNRKDAIFELVLLGH